MKLLETQENDSYETVVDASSKNDAKSRKLKHKRTSGDSIFGKSQIKPLLLDTLSKDSGEVTKIRIGKVQPI